MMHPRWLALPLAAVTGFASVTGCATDPAPRLLSPDLHVGTLDQRTRFELDDQGSAAARERQAPDDDVKPDTPKQQRRRKILYLTGLGALGFGTLGVLSFGIGGRIVQAQQKNGYDDGDLTRDREDQLQTTGKVMNGLAIGSAVIGLLGIITAATVYGIDHARCGELRPRRKDCGDRAASGGEAAGGSAAPSDAAEQAPAGSPSAAGDAPSGTSEAPGPGPAAGDATSTPASPSTSEAPVGPAPVGPAPAGPAAPAPVGPKPSPGAAPGR